MSRLICWIRSITIHKLFFPSTSIIYFWIKCTYKKNSIPFMSLSAPAALLRKSRRVKIGNDDEIQTSGVERALDEGLS